MNKPTYEELAAQVEVLKYHINRVIQASACNTGNEPSLSCFHRALDEAHDAFRATPAACLAQVKADAGRAGFIEGAVCARHPIKPNAVEIKQSADQYAERILKDAK
jgi:hypothetical protein